MSDYEVWANKSTTGTDIGVCVETPDTRTTIWIPEDVAKSLHHQLGVEIGAKGQN